MPLKHRRFSPTKWGVAGGCGVVDRAVHVPAVVGEINDDGFVSQFETVESVEKVPTASSMDSTMAA